MRKRIEDDVQWKEVGGGRVSRETLAVFIQVSFVSVCASASIHSFQFVPIIRWQLVLTL